MADAQYTKLSKYKQGTCFGFRMCLYYGIDLQHKKCKCTITKPPNGAGQKIERKFQHVTIQYSVNLKKTFNFSLYSRCISSLQRLTSTKAKKSLNFELHLKPCKYLRTCNWNPEVYDLTITEKEITLQNSLETTLESDENSEPSMGDNLGYEFHYGIFMKLKGKLQPAKWNYLYYNHNSSHTYTHYNKSNSKKIYNNNKETRITLLQREREAKVHVMELSNRKEREFSDN
ncbi:hypothetical protein C1646_670512 [Rhizophagus diaphanus]|nr:hypothetical protein C1646_670512 [Rhizophagus diaphanus] [Rhizophagus sp. MUCL 43196]